MKVRPGAAKRKPAIARVSRKAPRFERSIAPGVARASGLSRQYAHTAQLLLRIGSTESKAVIELTDLPLSAETEEQLLAAFKTPESQRSLADLFHRIVTSHRNAVKERSFDQAPVAIPATLQGAYARGEAGMRQLAERADMLTGEQFAHQVGLSRATVDNRRVANKLLALEVGAKRGVRYPEWQGLLIRDSSDRARFEDTLRQLRTVDPWSRYRFFMHRSPALGGMTPVEALRVRRGAEVCAAAKEWVSGEQGGG